MRLAAIIEKYGNPDADGDRILDPTWFTENMKVFPLPFPLRNSWPPYLVVNRFQAHRLAGDAIITALKAVEVEASNMSIRDGLDNVSGHEYLKNAGLDMWGGCFNFRPARGRDDLSMHAFGIAVDINPAIGRLGSSQDRDTYPRFIVTAFEEAGFVWGGSWQRPDAQHFELTKG